MLACQNAYKNQQLFNLIYSCIKSYILYVTPPLSSRAENLLVLTPHHKSDTNVKCRLLLICVVETAERKRKFFSIV